VDRGRRERGVSGDGGRRARRLLTAGALVGLATAGAGLLWSAQRPDSVPRGAVAVVNGIAVRAADYDRAVTALGSDRRDGLSEKDRRFVLDRLVDEELLVQRALDLGLPRSDRKIRNELVAAMIESATAEAATREPDDAELRRFFSANQDWFAAPGQLQVRQLWVRGRPARDDAAARARASDAAGRLRAGTGFAEVAAALGDPLVAPAPPALLPAPKLASYTGPDAIARLEELGPGAVTDPLPLAGGYQVLELVTRTAPRTPPLEAVAPQVRAEWRRRAGDAALERYLADLRRSAHIELAPTFAEPVAAGPEGR
jgi:parvulin-like peptidyl-prolyl isomerase